MCTICESNVSPPTRSARITRLPLPFVVPADNAASASLRTGSGSPVSIDSSTWLAPSTTRAVDRNLLAGPHTQSVVDLHVLERYVDFRTRRIDPVRGLRCKP